MKKTITKSMYGNVAILKTYCKKCKSESFVIGGIIQCCDEKIDDNFKNEKIKREVESENTRSIIPLKLKKEILKNQDNKCIYCDKSFNESVWDKKRCKYRHLKIHFDHFIAWCYSGNNNEENIYASCDICNGIKADKHYHDLISAKEAINERRKEKGY